MSYKRVLLALAVVIVVPILGWGGAYLLFKKPVFLTVPALSAVKHLDIHATSDNGATSYSGTVPFGAACDSVSAGISVVPGTSTPKVTLRLNIVQPANPCETTGEVSQEFSTSFTTAGARMPELVAVLLNGSPISYTVINE